MPVPRPGDGSRRGPAAALAHLAVPEPRRAVFAVRKVHLETRIREKGARRPFPAVAQHLSASPRAVAVWQRTHVDGVPAEAVEVRAARVRAR